MDEEKIREAIQEIIVILLGLIQDDGESIVEIFEEMDEDDDFDPESLPKISETGNAKRKERRIEADEMESPPISDSLMSSLSGCVSLLAKLRRGDSLNCMVIGEYTGMLSAVVSDSFGGPGGRVLCLGDCVDSEGHPLKEWVECVGERFQKTIWPVKGDITQSFQGMDRPLDLVVFSTCGIYTEMASLINKWAGLIKPGGIVCGTQYDSEQYAASVEAITEVFGEKRVDSPEKNSFWSVQIDAVKLEK
tara:strand:+ start:1675 stop:2418 length:744 start_codon:yes stop_codon:yes gene_type:complete